MKPNMPANEALWKLLDAWQEQPETSSAFDAHLRQRLLQEPRPTLWQRTVRSWRENRRGLRWAALPSCAAVVLAAGWLYWGGVASPPALATSRVARVVAGAAVPQDDAVLRDLQFLAQNRDLVDNLDFLAQPHTSPGPSREQE